MIDAVSALLFNSFEYLIFLPVVVALFFLIKPRFRWVFLLIASYYFYMCWKAEYILLIIFCTVINYFAALLIDRETNQTKRKWILAIDLIISFGVLFVYKYLGFMTQNINAMIQAFHGRFHIPTFELLLPVGISFFTFQTLSYTIDVFQKKTKVERHLGIFALYVSFFPQLVAGPIERSENLLPQFRKLQRFDAARTVSGLRMILWGLFKKVVIADRLAVIVDQVYNNVYQYNSFAFVVATVAFAFQIFCDFSGYSDIAVGSARIMGFDLMRNFDRPYFSKSTGEFWRRWHISLSSWFRDYLYIPLGGSRKGKARYYFNNMLTFAASGLWHGADWTFVTWGLLNGVYTSLGRAFTGAKAKVRGVFHLTRPNTIHKIIQILITFSLICFSWIFFRANSIHDALYIVTNLLPDQWSAAALTGSLQGLATPFQAWSAFGFVLVMEIVHYVQRNRVNPIRKFYDHHRAFRYACYLFLFISILMFGVTGNETAFIYFQF